MQVQTLMLVVQRQNKKVYSSRKSIQKTMAYSRTKKPIKNNKNKSLYWVAPDQAKSF